MPPTRDLEPTFLAVFRELKPRTPLPALEVCFYPYASLNSTVRVREGRLLIRLSDLLAAAPESVLEALAQILLRKLYRREIPAQYQKRYRAFALRREIAEQAERLRSLRGHKRLTTPRGAHHDLEAVFDELNARYFLGWLVRPQLSWAEGAARRHLAHFDPAHNAILVSRVFDTERVPRFVLEYVMYHEMLHLKHPVRQRRGRRCVHSPEFRREERLFARHAEAEAWLRRL